jgi:hypothetical protein
MENQELVQAECYKVIRKEERRLTEKYSSTPESTATDLYRSGIAVGAEVVANMILSLVEISDAQRQKLVAELSGFYNLNFIEVKFF